MPPPAVQSGLVVLIPRELQTQAGASAMRHRRWMALKVGHIVWVNVHWPVVKTEAREHLVREEIMHLQDEVHRLSGTDTGIMAEGGSFLTGDLNATLPALVEGVTGGFTFSCKPTSFITFAHRQSMLEMLKGLGLWAASTRSVLAGAPRIQAATWRINTAEGPRFHSQLDYACVPGGWPARAKVLDSAAWDWSDHRPLRLTATAGAAWAAYTKTPWACTGWTPKSAADEMLYRRLVRNSLLATRKGVGAGGPRTVRFDCEQGFLRESQRVTMESALAVDFLTPALATWMEKQASPEEVEAKRRMKCPLPPEEHTLARQAYNRLKRRRRAANRRAALTRLGKSRGYRPCPRSWCWTGNRRPTSPNGSTRCGFG